MVALCKEMIGSWARLSECFFGYLCAWLQAIKFLDMTNRDQMLKAEKENENNKGRES